MLAATLVACMLVIAEARPVAEAAPGPNAILGDVPRSGMGLSATGEALTPAETVTALAARGCAATTLAVAQGGRFISYIPGAPAFVNATFPATLPSGQFLAYRCSGATPAASAVPAVAAASATPTVTSVPARDCMPGTAISWTGTGRLGRFGKLPSSGVLRAKVLLIDYPDLPGTTTGIEGARTAMAQATQILSTESGGRLRIDFDVAGAYQRMPATSGTYWSGRSPGESPPAFIADVRPLLPASDAGYNFVVITDTGGSAIRGGWSFANDTQYTLDEQTRVVMPVFVSSILGTSGAGVWAHEFLHLLGLPDLYDETAGVVSRDWMLTWDRMSISSSSQLSMWHRWELGWLTDERVLCLTGSTSTVAIASRRVSDGTGSQLAVVKTGADTAVAVEVDINRLAEARSGQCTWNLVAYLVDASKKGGDGPLRLLPGAGAPRDEWIGRCAGSPVSRPSVTDPASGVTIEVLAATAETVTVRVTQPDTLTTTRPWAARPGTVTLSAGTTAPRLFPRPIDGIEWMTYPVRITSDRYTLGQIGFFASETQRLRGSYAMTGHRSLRASRDSADTLTFWIPAKRPSGPVTVRVAMPDGGYADYVINHVAR